MISARAVDVVIVSFNTRDVLRTCLQSVSMATPHDIVVVDNASDDGSRNMVATEFPHVRLLANATNVGYGSAVNQAMGACTAPYVLVLNSDTTITCGALTAVAAYLDRRPGVAVLGPRLVHADGRLQPSCYGFPTPFNLLVDYSNVCQLLRALPLAASLLGTRAHKDARAVRWVSGAAMAIRREAFEAIAGFDKSFFMYFEEVDLCYRLAQAGWEVHFAPVTDVVHVGGVSTRKRRNDMAVRFFTSLDHFYERHYAGPQHHQMHLIVTLIAVVRLARDSLRGYLARDTRYKEELARDIEAWLRLLRGDWRASARLATRNLARS